MLLQAVRLNLTKLPSFHYSDSDLASDSSLLPQIWVVATTLFFEPERSLNKSTIDSGKIGDVDTDLSTTKQVHTWVIMTGTYQEKHWFQICES